jgi:lysozyme family protein
MASQNFPRSLNQVLVHEGGFSNHKADPGGATNKGITIATFRKWVKRDGTVDDLKNISSADVAKVYRKHYWDKVRGDDLPSGVDYAVFDYAVNSGPGRAAKALQSVVGAKLDGAIGPETIGKASALNPSVVVNRLCDERLAFLKRLNTWGTFGKGWSSRVAGVREDALHMIAFSKPQAPVSPPKPVIPPAPTKPASAPRKGGWIVLAVLAVGGLLTAGWEWLASLFT